MSAVHYPEVVVGALLVDAQGQIFVARFSKVAGRYAIPGGHVEYGETIAQALVREIREETGLIPVQYHLLRVGERIRPPLYKDGNRHLVYLDFVVVRWTGDLQLDGDELNDGLWRAPEAALDLPLTDTTRQAIEFYMGRIGGAVCGYDPGFVD